MSDKLIIFDTTCAMRKQSPECLHRCDESCIARQSQNA